MNPYGKGAGNRPARIVMFTLVSMLFIASATIAAAQTYSVLYSFTGGADGGTPGPITRDAVTGNIYGVTTDGGDGGCEYPGCGTVFELTSTGVESVLRSFTGDPDGAEPLDVFRDVKGNLFGATLSGGRYGGGDDGTVFRIGTKGVEKVLHSFKGGTDGDEPSSGLIQDPSSGDFYGTTASGGAYNQGTVYKITASGSKTVLYSFGAKGTVGNGPAGKLVQDGNTENLYGTLVLGGSSDCGVVFELTLAAVETPLYSFTGAQGDGCQPGPGDPGLVMDAQGDLFGTTFYGGIENNGIIFELTAGGVEKVLYKFKGVKKGDGAWPYAGLVLDESTGNLFGTTEIGGAYNLGTVFELSPPLTKNGPWTETILYSFTGGADGDYPLAGLVRDAQTGELYGTARDAHTYNWGVVFKLAP